VKVEKYLTAVNASDLTVRADREGPVDALVQVALSRGKVGHALLRLHSEFDGVARRGLKPDQVFRQMPSMPAVHDGMFMMATEFEALPPTRERLRAVDRLILAVLCWWMDPTCKCCGGTGWVSSTKNPKRLCIECRGRKEAPIPEGEDGRHMLAFMDGCMHKHRASVKGRMAR
jgi:hypothetical protein